jgi:hypothetical protein
VLAIELARNELVERDADADAEQLIGAGMLLLDDEERRQ